MTDKLKEDTVSADRKERIIFDPEAWRKSDKSGRKTSAITSRQNFDNEKFTRKASKEEQVDEGTIQPSGDSKVDSAGPTQSDTISKDTKPKKSNNPQIEFVTGTANPNGSSSTAIGSANAMGRKLSESLIEKAIKQVKSDAGVPFDGPYTKPGEHKDEFGNTVKTKNVPGFLAKRAMRKVAGQPPVKEEAELSEAQYSGLEKEDKPGKKSTEFKGSKNAITGKTVEGWKDEKKPTQEETVMSKTYADFIQQLQEYNAGKDGVYRHKGSYGGSYDSNDDHDDDEPKKPAAPAVKRGRGRPAGSKSGANQKVTTGKSYGGIATHNLSLPNSK